MNEKINKELTFDRATVNLLDGTVTQVDIVDWYAWKDKNMICIQTQDRIMLVPTANVILSKNVSASDYKIRQ